MSRQEACREVRRAVEANGGRVAFARRAKVDPGTLSDFIDGTRWPQAATRTKIEQALGWAPGHITDLEDGVIRLGGSSAVLDAIAGDPDLLPEARDHLLNQYQLLRRLGRPAASDPAVAQVEDELVTDVKAVREVRDAAAPKRPKRRT